MCGALRVLLVASIVASCTAAQTMSKVSSTAANTAAQIQFHRLFLASTGTTLYTGAYMTSGASISQWTVTPSTGATTAGSDISLSATSGRSLWNGCATSTAAFFASDTTNTYLYKVTFSSGAMTSVNLASPSGAIISWTDTASSNTEYVFAAYYMNPVQVQKVKASDLSLTGTAVSGTGSEKEPATGISSGNVGYFNSYTVAYLWKWDLTNHASLGGVSSGWGGGIMFAKATTTSTTHRCRSTAMSCGRRRKERQDHPARSLCTSSIRR